jgi:hypothetical protein
MHCAEFVFMPGAQARLAELVAALGDWSERRALGIRLLLGGRANRPIWALVEIERRAFCQCTVSRAGDGRLRSIG